MTARKPGPSRKPTPAAKSQDSAGPSARHAAAAKSTARSTVSGSSRPARAIDPGASADALLAKQAVTERLAAAMPFNANKPLEHGRLALQPQPGQSVQPANPSATGSTLTETNESDKVGGGDPRVGMNPASGPLDRVRVDSGDRVLTTNQGVAIADNQNSLKAGLRGPALLEDFILREKITHFDHERIPERIVHARGSGAHGYFECYESLERYTARVDFRRRPASRRRSSCASPPSLGERGSADTVRDVRGFAVKFYTDEGNWDLVGNNIPVFFIQDAMKFPDLVHAAKPEPHFAMPQAASAHDTFWDFVSLMPESTHMLMWAMSDRAMPAQLPDDAGLRRAHVPFRQRRGRIALRQVPLAARSPGRTRSTGTRR